MHRQLLKLLFLFFLSLPMTLQAQDSFTDMFVFGDSLSDNGNFIVLAGQPSEFTLPPPFFGNRVSNGPLAVERLADLMGFKLEGHFVNPETGTNFAVAGARARGTSAIDLTAQVSTFLASQANKVADDALYVFFIGNNDVRDIRKALVNNSPKKERVEIFRQALNAIDTNIRNLIDRGAKHFLVVNVLDLSQIPETIVLAEANPNIRRQTRRRSLAFNRVLGRKLDRIRFEHNAVKLAEFDLAAFTRPFIRNGRAFNFDVVDAGCLTSLEIEQITNITNINPQCGENLEFINNFIFFDQLHPSAKAHERIGRGLYSVVPEL